MPELPEVQAHAERLTTSFAGATLEGFEVLSFAALKTALPAPEAALGHVLRRVGRRGKHLLLEFDADPTVTFVVHLMQGGRLRPDDKRARRPRGGLARWLLSDPGPRRSSGDAALLLTEAGTEHKAGVWVVAGDALARPPLLGLGPEADQLDADELGRRFTGASMRLHSFLRDQALLAGLGRRLANEVCHRARLSPFVPTRTLGAADAARVTAAIHELVAEGLAAERGREDMSASAERPAAVHNRPGSPCPACGDTVRAVDYRDYSVHYCPTCQTGGRVLADNTTSRFLK
jgi:formamidopyrimidine-DNA glycosylase